VWCGEGNVESRIRKRIRKQICREENEARRLGKSRGNQEMRRGWARREIVWE
jgi:hypothetical protein